MIYFNADTPSWRDNSYEGTPEVTKDPFLAFSGKVVQGLGVAEKVFSPGTLPVGEGTNIGNTLYQPILVSRDLTYTDRDASTRNVWTMDLKLSVIDTTDMSEVEVISLVPESPSVTGKFRDVLPVVCDQKFHGNGLTGGVYINADELSALSARKYSVSDGPRAPGRIPLAKIADADADLYGVLIQDGYAIPQLEASNQLWGVDLATGTPWRRRGWIDGDSSYPTHLGNWHSGQDADSYPWGNTYVTAALEHTRELYSVLGKIGPSHILVAVDSIDYKPRVVSDFANIPHVINNCGAGVGADYSMFINVGFERLWRFFYASGAFDPFQPGSGDFADLSYFDGFGLDVDNPNCGQLLGQPVRGVPPGFTKFRYGYESLTGATGLITNDMEAMFTAASERANYTGLAVSSMTTRYEIIEAATGTTVATFAELSAEIELENKILNGPSVLDIQISNEPYTFDMELIGVDYPFFWKVKQRTMAGYYGGRENINSLDEGWGQLMHKVILSLEEDDPLTLGTDPYTVFNVHSADGGVCSIEGQTHPGGIAMYYPGASNSMGPINDDPEVVAHILSTIWAPLYGGSEALATQYRPTPRPHSDLYASDSSGLIIFVPRAQTADPSYVSDSIFGRPTGSSSSADKTAWNTAVANSHKIQAYQWDSVEEEITATWSVDTFALVGTFYLENGSGCVDPTCGDCLSNPVLTANFLYVILKGGSGPRLYQILAKDLGELSAGTVVKSIPVTSLYPTTDQALISPSFYAIHDNLMVVDRRPVITVRKIGSIGTYLLRLAE